MDSFFYGVLLGLGVAIPIGPLNILIMNYSLRGFKLGFGIGLGAMSADMLYFLLLSFGVLALLNEPWILKLLGTFGSVFLFYIAFASFKSVAKITQHQEIKQGAFVSCFIKGFLLNSINPFIVGFWLSLSSVVASNENFYASIAGVIISLFGWVFGLSFGVSRAKRLLSDKVARIFAIISAFLMIAFGIFLLYNTFFKGL